MAERKLNKRITVRLRGSSILEAVTASVLFLILFSLAMQALVGMSTRQVHAGRFVEAEKDYRVELGNVLRGEYSLGKHEKRFPWGSLEILLEPYGKSEGLHQVTIVFRLEREGGKQVRRHIIKLHIKEGLCEN